MVQPTTQDHEFRDYSAVVRRRWPVVAAVTLICIVIAAAVYLASPKQYRATAAVFVTPTSVQGASGTGGQTRSAGQSSVDMDTEAQFVSSKVVARRVQKMLHSSTPVSALDKKVSVTVPPNSSVLDIAYDAKSPLAAKRGADAFANAYIAERTALTKSALAAQQASVQSKLAYLQKQLISVSSHVVSKTTHTVNTYYETQKLLIEQQINQLHQQQALLSTASTTPGTLISSADLPGAPISPRKSYFLVGGILGGLLIGLAAAIVLEMRDDRVHSVRELRRRRAVPVLAEARFSGPAPSWKQLLQPGPAGLAVGELRNAVVAMASQGERTVLVVPVDESPSGPAIAAALTAALADSEGSGTLVSRIASFPQSQSFLEGRTGTKVVRASDGIADTRRLIGELTSAEDGSYVVVEAPPAALAADGPALSAHVDTVVPVVDINGTTLDELDNALHALRMAGASVPGVVAVDAGVLLHIPFGREPVQGRNQSHVDLLGRLSRPRVRVSTAFAGGTPGKSSRVPAAVGDRERVADGESRTTAADGDGSKQPR
jgi:capsular polysaccharide biosynthesis protein